MPKDNRTWMIENAIAQYAAPVEGTDMHVQTFRTATGVALESWSSDGGYNWTFPVNSTLPNPNSRVRAPQRPAAANGCSADVLTGAAPLKSALQ